MGADLGGPLIGGPVVARSGLTLLLSCDDVGEQPCQNGLTGWGYLPAQWRLANVAYPLLCRQRRVNDGGSDGALERPLDRIFQAPTQAPNATTGETALSRNTA